MAMKILFWPVALVVVAAGALGGCGSARQSGGNLQGPGSSVSSQASCNVQMAQAFVGRQATAALVEDARVRSGASMARLLRPGQMVTKEYFAGRLNLQVDSAGVIVGATCG
jgi:peptidase inhibitor I78 family protein